MHTKSSLSVFTTLGSPLDQSSQRYKQSPDSTVLWTRMQSVREYPDSSISKVLTVLKRRMITTLNRKLLEKQRLQNRFASYEVHIGHLFLQYQCCCQFWKSFNPVYIQILKFFTGRTDGRTDRQTDRKNRLLNPFAHAHAG